MFVIMEYWTRWAIAVVSHITDGETLATVLLYEVVFKYGTSRRLITDNGSNLTSDVMKALAKALELRHSTTSVEHPQSDGLVERMNRTLKRALAAYVERDLSSWDDKLPLVMFAYNTAQQASIKMAFEATFGRKTVIPTTADISWPPKTAQGRNWESYLATHIPIIQS